MDFCIILGKHYMLLVNKMRQVVWQTGMYANRIRHNIPLLRNPIMFMSWRRGKVELWSCRMVKRHIKD